jgi:hypothetical protein
VGAKGWLLVLLVANAIVWFAIAQGWPQLVLLPTLAAASRIRVLKSHSWKVSDGFSMALRAGGRGAGSRLRADRSL